MMSAAILLTAVGERGNVHSVSADQGVPEGDSFASSLSERIDYATSGQEKNLSVASPLILPGSKVELPATKSDEVMAARTVLKAGLKKETVAAPVSSANSAPKSSGVRDVVTLQPRSTAAPSAKVHESKPAMEVVDSSELHTADTDHSTIDAAPPRVASATGSAPEDLARVGVAENYQPLVSSSDHADVVCRPVEPSGVPKEIPSPQASVRTQIGQTGPNSTKTLETGRTIHTAEPIIAVRDTAVDTSAVPVPALACAVTPQAKTDTSANWDGDVKPVVGGTSVGVFNRSTATVVHKQVGSADKGDDVDTRAMAFPQKDDLGTSPKGRESVAASSPTSFIDIEKKPQGGTEPVANAVHSVTAIGTVTVATGGILPGSPVVDLPGAKSTVASTSVHEAGPAVGSREQGAQSMLAMPSDGIPRTLTATPTALEVGIQDETHGWLRVRAEMANGGSVNASVSVTSPAAQEMLHRELPSLTAYLQEEKVSVNTIVVHAPVQSAVEQRSSGGADAAGGQAAQSGNDGEERRQYAGKTASGGLDEAGAPRSVPGFEEDGSLQHGTYSAGGSWLSVRA